MAKNALHTLEQIITGLTQLKEMGEEASLSADAQAKISQQRNRRVQQFNSLLPNIIAEFRVLGASLDFNKAEVVKQTTDIARIGAALNYVASDAQSGDVVAQLSVLGDLHAVAPDLADQIMTSLPGFSAYRAALLATLKGSAPGAAPMPQQPARTADVAKVTSKALAIFADNPHSEQALCLYLASQDVMETEASHALVALKDLNPAAADRAMGAMPIERQNGMILGGTSFDQIAILNVGAPEFYVNMIERQLANDKAPEDEFTSDLNNMSAPYLLARIIEANDNANVILGLLGKVVVKEIAQMVIPRRGGKKGYDPDATREAQREITAYWNDHRRDIRDETIDYEAQVKAAAAQREETVAPVTVLPRVDLNKDIDLDAI